MKLKKIWGKLFKSEQGLILNEKGSSSIFISDHLLLDVMRNYVESNGNKIKLIEHILPFYEIKRGNNWWYIIPINPKKKDEK